MTYEEKYQLYQDAKDAYYNGDPIMSDLEFDKLEQEIGLENSGYIGTHHSDEYTVKHPFLMGSLSKVQIKENKNSIFSENHITEKGKDFRYIDFQKFTNEAENYFKRSPYYNLPIWEFQATPKYDGCSVEIVIDNKGNMVSASTRGDGEYGKPIDIWVSDEWEKNFRVRAFQLFKYGNLPSDIKYLVVRGECLIKKSIFEQKYKNTFVNPRSFVAGILGQDWNNGFEQRAMRKDLSIVCYDYRFIFNDGSIKEIDYTKKGIFGLIDLPGEKPLICKSEKFFSADTLYKLYDYFDDVRENETDFALDGFVLKPAPSLRLQELERERQRDCVAIKFLPEIATTTIEDIEWNVGKTGEYFPTAICKEVILGDKKVTRASLHNYANMRKNLLGIGAEIKISLAGDIIPFIYGIIKTAPVLNMKLPEDSCPVLNLDKSGKTSLHLMKKVSEDERMKISLMSSVNALKIKGIGEKIAEKLFNEVCKVDNVLMYMFDENISKIKEKLGDSKSTNNIIESLQLRRKTLTIYEIVMSLCFPNCGEKMSKVVTNIILGNSIDTKGANKEVYAWAVNSDSPQRRTIQKYIDKFNISTKKLEINPNVEDKIKVILTGDPKACTNYATKKLWLEAHPEYEETTSWKEVKILFTNDLSSTTSKMEKAKKLGIEIKMYEK